MSFSLCFKFVFCRQWWLKLCVSVCVCVPCIMNQFIQEKSGEPIWWIQFKDSIFITIPNWYGFLSLLVLLKKWHMQANFQVIFPAFVNIWLCTAKCLWCRPPVLHITAAVKAQWIQKCEFCRFCFVFIVSLYFTLVF